MKKILAITVLSLSALLLSACSDKAAETKSKTTAAESGYQEGTHYITLAQPFPPEGNKNVVTEFFWYGCPHCQSFEPILKEWETNKKPFNTILKKVPAIWNETLRLHAKLYYIAETMNIKASAVHKDLFTAVINQRQEKNLDKQTQVFARVFAKHGMSEETFMNLLNSDKVQAKVEKAEALMKPAQIRSTPTIIVNGTYQIQNQAASSMKAVMDVANHLIKQGK